MSSSSSLLTCLLTYLPSRRRQCCCPQMRQRTMPARSYTHKRGLCMPHSHVRVGTHIPTFIWNFTQPLSNNTSLYGTTRNPENLGQNSRLAFRPKRKRESNLSLSLSLFSQNQYYTTISPRMDEHNEIERERKGKREKSNLTPEQISEHIYTHTHTYVLVLLLLYSSCYSMVHTYEQYQHQYTYQKGRCGGQSATLKPFSRAAVFMM